MARKKKRKHMSLIVYASILGGFILYVTIFSLIPISADSPDYLVDIVRAAVKIKQALIYEHAYYSLTILIIVAFIVPIYLKLKK